MLNEYIILLLTLKYLDDNLQISDAELMHIDLPSLQKRIYCVQMFDINLGYKFAWYLNGPYSDELSEDIFEMNRNINNIFYDMYLLNDNYKIKLNKVKEFLSIYKQIKNTIGLEQYTWLQLLSSVHWLFYNGFWIKSKSKDKIFYNLNKEQLYPYVEFQYNKAWQVLESYNLLKTKNN